MNHEMNPIHLAKQTEVLVPRVWISVANFVHKIALVQIISIVIVLIGYRCRCPCWI